MHHFESAACWSSAEACRGSSSPKTVRSGPLSRQVAELRVVSVHDQARVGGQLTHRLAPAPGQQLQLAVAVELVAKEVPEQDGPGPKPPGHFRQRRLVHLEEAQLRVARGEQGRSDSGDQVGARAVVGQANRWREDACRHRSGRRLPVRRRDERRPPGKASREAVDGARIELPEQLSRHCRASAGADDAGEGGRRPREQDLGRERKREAHGPHATRASPRSRELFGSSPSRGM